MEFVSRKKTSAVTYNRTGSINVEMIELNAVKIRKHDNIEINLQTSWSGGSCGEVNRSSSSWSFGGGAGNDVKQHITLASESCSCAAQVSSTNHIYRDM